MRKIGLYIQRQADPEIRGKLERVRPALVTVHLDGGDLIPWIRQTLPETFVVGRYWWSPADQDRLLYLHAAYLLEVMLRVKGANQCQALMLFNEFLPSPYEAGYAQIEGKPDKASDQGWRLRAERYDNQQMEFRQACQREGLEAVAWNFGAGNWAEAAWYQRLQPLTWASHRYVGHHIYGWPRLAQADPWWRSSLDATLRVMDGMADKTHLVTELAVTRMYAGQGPDQGWLSRHGDSGPLSLDDYAGDLAAVNDRLCQRGHVLGAALFNAAPNGDWATFAVTTELVERVSRITCQVSGGGGQPGGEPGQPPAQALRFRIPLAAGSYRVTQWYGEDPEHYNNWGHEGVDLGAAAGTPVLASAAGVAAKVPKSDVYGTYVRLVHEGTFATADGARTESGRFETVYAHLSRVDVKPGQAVKAGEVIGLVGSTGRSTGDHLHFGLRLPGQKPADKFWGYSDPAPWVGLERPQTEDRRRQLVAEIRTKLQELEELI